MEDHPKHDKKKKKNTKAMPLAISIGSGGGAGRLGMGGIVLFGGALVTATIVSAALAFKIRRSSKKSRSPSPETQSVDAPDQLEFMVKTNQDLPFDSQNQSDGLTSMKEIMQTKTIPDSSPFQEEKQNCDEEVDSGVGSMFSVVGEDEESYVNSVSEEKIGLAFVECQTELGFPIVDGGEEQKKYCNEDKQQTDTEEEEYKAIEGVGEVEERTAPMEAACSCVNGVKEEKEKDCEDEMINVANGEGELSTSDETETGYAAADGVVSETEEENQETQCKLVMRDEACLDDDDDDDDDETITIQAQEEMHQSRTFSSGSAVDDDDDDDRAAVREVNPPPPNQLMMMNKDEDKECEIQPAQFMNKNRETADADADAEAELLMIAEDEPGKSKVEDEILLVPQQIQIQIQAHAHARSDVTTAKSEVGIWADERAEEASHMIEESMREDGKGQKKDDDHKDKGSKSLTQRFVKAKGTFLYNSCYSELLLLPLPFPEISLVPTLLLIFMLLALGTALQRYLLK